MTMGQGSSKEATRNFAEVFTSPHVVFFMILQPKLRDVMTDENKVILDPAAGQGQYGCSELVWRMFYTALDLPPRERVKCILTNLSNIYHLELQPKNVDWCKRHLLATVCDAYEFFFGEPFLYFMEAAKIIQSRVIQCNALEWLAENTPAEKRDKEFYNGIKDQAKRGFISKACVDRILNAKNQQQSLF